MKKRLSTILLVLAAAVNLTAQNSNLSNLMSSSDWSSTFPKRAGVVANKPAGYTSDFYSYENFQTAISEMADYSVSIRKKAGIAGQLTTVTRKSSGVTYEISSVNNTWWSHPGAESTITVDFATFINRDSPHNNKRELAAFLANVTKETTGGTRGIPVGSGQNGDHATYGLYWVTEVGKGCGYSQADANYPPVGGQCYYGRGPIQLSWNYNYGQVSKFLFNDQSLLNNPSLVEQNGVLAFKTAIWFWMSPQCPKPSCHQVMHDLWTPGTGDYTAGSKMYKNGFAHTNNIINGGLECRSNSSAAFTEKVALRSELYKHYLGTLGFSNSEVALENSSDYTTTCHNGSSNTMVNYQGCDVSQSDVVCTTPTLGDDQTLCSESVALNAGVTLAAGETIKWFKNEGEIDGETAASYSADVAGTYKAVISSDGCVRSDEVVINQGGSIQVSVDDDGIICASNGNPDVNITVTGGAGLYKLYDEATNGTEVASGSAFVISSEDVPIGQSNTYYVEEPAGQEATIGLSSRPNTDSDFLVYQFQRIDIAANYNSYRTVLTALDDVTLESIDFELANIGNGSPASLVIKVFKLGGLTEVATKTIDLENLDFGLWDQKIYTVNLDIGLENGQQYELNITPSNCMIFMSQYKSDTKLFDYPSFVESGVASLDGCLDPSNRDWGVFKNVNMGSYNWKFSTGGGAAVSCGRVPVTVTHDCATGVGSLSKKTINVFPNPAFDVINVSVEQGMNNGTIELVNSFGQVVFSKSLNTSSNNNIKINTENLNVGLYFVKLTSGTDSFSSSVVIAK